MPAPTVHDALTFPVATVGAGVSVGGADRCDNDADVSVVVMVMMVVVMMSLRRLRSRKGCETKGGGSRKSGESFGLSRHGEPRMLCV
jgi:hypothetical protein